MAFRNNNAPLVGLLYNPAVPSVLEEAGALVEYIEIAPEQLAFGPARNGPSSRFHYVNQARETLKKCAKGRVVAGHGNGLSLLSAMPLEEYLLRATAVAAHDMDFAWYSECLSLPPLLHRGMNTRAGRPPFTFNENTFDILREKLARVREALGIPLMLENGCISASAANMDMSEPEFLNRLYRDLGCGILLDLHTVYLNWRNGGPTPQKYLEELDPAAVHEIHLAGGDEPTGFHTRPRSYRTPPEVWSWAFEFVPRYKNLRAITFDFDEKHFDHLGVTAIANELKCMHLLAHLVIRPREAAYA